MDLLTINKITKSLKSKVEISIQFFRLGFFVYGNTSKKIVYIRKELVEKRKWIDEKNFLDIINLSELIPGPRPTKVVLYCGYRKAGIRGLIIGGLSFLIPSCFIAGLISYIYNISHNLIPNFENYLISIRLIVIIIILQQIIKLWSKTIRNIQMGLAMLIVGLFNFINGDYVLSLLLGLFLIYISHTKNRSNQLNSISITSIFFIFMKGGSILFGSVYVLFYFIQYEFIDLNNGLTINQLIDALFISSFLPGSFLSISTFIGFQISGLLGAIAATIGIIIPSIVNVILLDVLIKPYRHSKKLLILIDGFNVAVIGILLYSLISIGTYTLTSARPIIIFTIMLLFSIKWSKINSLYLLFLAVILGFINQNFTNWI